MKIKTDIIEKNDYLQVEITGTWKAGKNKILIEKIAEEAQKRSYKKVLLDLRKYLGNRSDWDKFFLGKHIAEVWGYPLYLKVAVLDLKENINKFAENTAVNRGAILLVESDIEKSIHWLIGDGVS